mgnify:CR=1 FL=1
MSDQELIQQFLNGRQQGVEELIHRHKERVFTYINIIVKDQALAEDIFQDTFIKVVQSLSGGRYKDSGRFLSWVIRIAHNLIIDHFRREKQINEISGETYESFILNSRKYAIGNVEENLIQEQIIEDVRALIHELPEEQKEVILLRHYGGLSFKEIAEQTNVSINTALGRMRYALINLRKLIHDKKLTLTLQ